MSLDQKREREENVGRKGSAGSNGGRLIEWWTGSPVNSIRSIRDTRKGGPGQPRRGGEGGRTNNSRHSTSADELPCYARRALSSMVCPVSGFTENDASVVMGEHNNQTAGVSLGIR